MMRYVNAHEPALLPQEAALLPALTARSQATLRPNMIWPRNEDDFRSFEVDSTVIRTADTAPVSTGSAAGRAVLSAAGISLPGVTGMRRGCRRAQDRQTVCCTLVCVEQASCVQRPCDGLELL